ncbi:MAG TPA: methyltransferase domain-containing protein [Planctomycetota bacterium]|nr:methyltransferase domain-containing protein [Planctomycetota bacterium]
MNPDRARWNAKYAKTGHDLPSIPLLRYQGRLAKGRALDVAGGLGESAAVLALAGWTVTLVDLSEVAVSRARARARELKADLHVVHADARRLPFRGPFETIVVARFLDRSLAGDLTRLLAPGGTLFCEQPMTGIPPDYCIGVGEFPRLYPDLEVLLDTSEGDCAVFIGRKRP